MVTESGSEVRIVSKVQWCGVGEPGQRVEEVAGSERGVDGMGVDGKQHKELARVGAGRGGVWSSAPQLYEARRGGGRGYESRPAPAMNKGHLRSGVYGRRQIASWPRAGLCLD